MFKKRSPGNIDPRSNETACSRFRRVSLKISHKKSSGKHWKYQQFLVCTLLILVFLFALSKAFFFKQQREIAITIDDLPLLTYNAEESNKFMEHMTNALVQYQAPAIGFVIAERVNSSSEEQLNYFLQQGFLLGNHSFSHPNLRNTSAETYIENIAKADEILSKYMTQPKYFRYPHLAQGKWGKKKTVHRYLAAQGYRIAPITIDSKDFTFNAQFAEVNFNTDTPEFKKIKKAYLDFIRQQTVQAEQKDQWFSFAYQSKKHILLLHANVLNNYLLADVLKIFKTRGYRFISLDEAIAKP